MNNNTLEKLDFALLIKNLKHYASSELGKRLIDNLTPTSHLKSVKKRLDETEEAKILLEAVGGVPIQGVGTIDQLVDKVEKGIVLEAAELTQVSEFLRGCRKLKEFMQSKSYHAPTLSSYSEIITPYKKIEEEINFSVRNGIVDSGASKELKKIRRHIEIEQEKIQEKLEKFLRNTSYKTYIQDFFISNRNGHYTIPVKAAFKNQVEGTVIAESSKGNTVFIEPRTVQKHTTALLSLQSEESIEEYKILSSLTGLIYDAYQKIQLNIDVIGQYDLIFAKGKYAISINGIKPQVNDYGYTKIIQGKHPLLEGNVVPLNFEIGKNYRTLIITGPNAGGKTVVLKAVGLLTIATQLGLFISAQHGTDIAIYENIFADIGDNQSLENSLSTFSSHIKNLAYIINKTNKSTLLLFDEIGSGTEPNEGAGLAIAILEEVYKKGAITVATTHYGEIKNYSANHPDFENAAMKFKKETLEPLYQLQIGQSGDSNALWISQKMGIQSNVLKRAKQYIDTKEYNFDLVDDAKIRRKTEEVVNKQPQYIYQKGDKVYLADKEQEAIVYEGQDDKRNVKVLFEGEIIDIFEKRVKLLIPATKLYPPDYDLNSLFVSFKERKLEKDIIRGSKKALKAIEKERKLQNNKA
ncbi:mannonate oxidoreductase [Candidatus Epulonipiscium fishelsonii]|uniref:Mannonate oxidoreductase n=1 Tax=Candidatus Epulonipiscium fishelsonii TaxID=77094 RepID=A0ACC8XF65_9FIRM|nr:mannonate oxidoreductase [Epulopiscium sp. SCG-B11WGA-EpuloA1]ONI43255.1 mannonate oxidoreductase [Epulopiscium sp. SCG-B05WGA-EpuloA1]